MFTISRKEWVELVALMKVMSKPKLSWSNNKGLPIKGRTARLECIQRKELNGFRTYRRIEEEVDGVMTPLIEITTTPLTPRARLEETLAPARTGGTDSSATESSTIGEVTAPPVRGGGGVDRLTVDAELWADAANHAAELLRTAPSTAEGGNDAMLEVDDAMEAFLDDIEMQSIGGISEGPFHILLGINGQKTAVTGVLNRCGSVATRLLDGGRAANLKLLQTGTRFAQPMAQKVNYEGEEVLASSGNSTEAISRVIRDRMVMIERMGSSLKYDDVADKVFRCNLAMIDLHMGRLLTEMVRISYLEDLTHIDALVQRINEENPLKVKQELIDKHHYYEHKLRQLLFACLGGMRPAKIYTGSDNLPAFFLLLTPDGTPVLFDASDRDLLSRFLMLNTRLERGPLEKDHYGVLERENNQYFFKLNLKLALTKRPTPGPSL